jgi:hypothetical protein
MSERILSLQIQYSPPSIQSIALSSALDSMSRSFYCPCSIRSTHRACYRRTPKEYSIKKAAIVPRFKGDEPGWDPRQRGAKGAGLTRHESDRRDGARRRWLSLRGAKTEGAPGSSGRPGAPLEKASPSGRRVSASPGAARWGKGTRRRERKNIT